MLANVLDVDKAMSKTVLIDEDPAAVLFDFEAAFPSVQHKFTFKTLEALGLPAEFVRLITKDSTRTTPTACFFGERVPQRHYVCWSQAGRCSLEC